jgi:hypothetical protein
MGHEQPTNVTAFPNAPGMITVHWSHSGQGVYWFVLEQESPSTFWVAGPDTRVWSVTGLEPNHTYRYRICAVYDYNRICSDQGGGWVSVTTFSPEHHPERPAPTPSPTEGGPQLPRFISSFESLNYPGHLMRHRNYLGDLTRIFSALDRADATFRVRTDGLTGERNSVSFESINFPGHFLRHQFLRIKLHPNDGSDLFRRDATFLLRPASPGVFSQVRYESVNYPGHFIRHSNFGLRLAPEDGSELFRLDSTWRRLHPPLENVPPGAISFESSNYGGRFIRHRNSLGELAPIGGSALDRADTTFAVRPALSGFPIAVSLESVNYPGYFMRHQNYRLKLHANDGTDLFRQDASFIYNDGATWEGNGGVSLESVNLRGHHIRHRNFELWLAQSDGTGLFNQDATWQPVPARNGR